MRYFAYEGDSNLQDTYDKINQACPNIRSSLPMSVLCDFTRSYCVLVLLV